MFVVMSGNHFFPSFTDFPSKYFWKIIVSSFPFCLNFKPVTMDTLKLIWSQSKVLYRIEGQDTALRLGCSYSNEV